VPDNNIIGYVPRVLVIRSRLAAASLVPAVRGIIGRVDPSQPISGIRPLGDVVRRRTTSHRRASADHRSRARGDRGA